MTEPSVPGMDGFSAAEPDIATALATRIMALDWMDRRKWTCESQADRHGEIQQMIDAALAPVLAEKERAETNLDAIRSDAADLRALLVEANAKRSAAEAALAGERERAEHLFATVRKAHVAMTMACALPGVASEYDFSEAIASTEAALVRRAAAIRAGE